MEDKDVIEVEVLSETKSEAVPSAEPKRNVTYLSNGDKADRLLNIASFISRFITPAIFFAAAAGLTFSILYSQSGSIVTFVLMLLFWFLSLGCLITSITGVFIRQRAARLQKKDAKGK